MAVGCYEGDIKVYDLTTNKLTFTLPFVFRFSSGAPMFLKVVSGGPGQSTKQAGTNEGWRVGKIIARENERVLEFGALENHETANLLAEAGPGEMQHVCVTQTPS